MVGFGSRWALGWIAAFGALAVALALLPSAQAAILDNGVVQLGIGPNAELNAGSAPSCAGTVPYGIRYVPTNCDGISPGCACEGWGVAYNGANAGYANVAQGTAFPCGGGSTTPMSTPTEAIVVSTWCSVQVTHHFSPSTSPNLFEAEVTIENIGGATINDVQYRRVMDWDVQPTNTADIVTIDGRDIDPGTPGIQYPNALVKSTDGGFASGNPLATDDAGTLGVGPSPCTYAYSIPTAAPMNDVGPCDHGALFDFNFGSLGPGDTKSFLIFYGAAGNEDQALLALNDVDAEIWSFGQCNGDAAASPSNFDDRCDAATGAPNTFIFAFGNVDFDPPELGVEAGGPYITSVGVPVATVPVITGGVPAIACNWSGATFSSPSLCAAPAPTVQSTTPGSRLITLSAADSIGQTAADTAELRVYAKPTAMLLVDDEPGTCIDSSVGFVAYGATDPDGLDSGIVSYDWVIRLDGAVYRTYSTAIIPRIVFPHAGSVQVTLTLTDADPIVGVTVLTAQMSTLGDPPCPPELAPIPDLNIALGASVGFTLKATDADDPSGNWLLYDVSGPSAHLLAIDGVTGQVTWTPDEVGHYCFVGLVTDKDYLSDSQPFCIVVYIPTVDSDNDGTFDGSDNCPAVVNTNQADSDGDGVGDACSQAPPADDGSDGAGTSGGSNGSGNGAGGSGSGTLTPGTAGATGALTLDTDRDGVQDASDNCVHVPNVLQLDLDLDRRGDACDADRDGDGVPQSSASASAAVDNCPDRPNADQTDLDGDGIGDACLGDPPAALDGAPLAGAGQAGVAPGSGSAGAGAQAGLLSRCRTADCSAPATAPTQDSMADRMTRGPVVGLLVGALALVAIGAAATTLALRAWKA